MKFSLKEVGVILLGTIVLCLPVFFNGYPLLTYDSGSYIHGGFTGIVPVDRPLAYGLFIKYTSLSSSLSFTVYAQCILLSAVLYLFLKNVIRDREKSNLYFIGILTALTLLTNIGWCAGQIMADVFTAIFIISFISLVLFERLSKPQVIFLAFALVLSCIVHLTHLLMAMSASVILLLYWFIFRKRSGLFTLSLKRVGLVIGLTIVSWTTVLLINNNHEGGGGYRLNKGSHVFLMAHFIEVGTMEEFLKQNCDKPEFKDCKTCLYKDSLEHTLGEYLWSWNSSLYKTGGWEGTEQEHNFIFKKMFSDLNFVAKNIYGSLKFGTEELFLTQVGYDINPLEKGSPPWIEIEKWLPREMNKFLASKQNTEPYLNGKLETLNMINTALLFVSGTVLLVYFIRKKTKGLEYFFVILVLLFYALNAFLTAGLNAPSPRFQGRIAWLIPMLAIVLIINNKSHISSLYKRLVSKNNLS